MIKSFALKSVLVVASLALGFHSHAQEKALVKGLIIKHSIKIRKGVYNLPSPLKDSAAVIIIEGSNITVDFNNATIQGSRQPNQPDKFYGIGILVRNGKNITIKNLKAKGYKIAIMAISVEKLSIQNCDLSYNYRPRLNSTQEKEDISDWMSYHQNEKDEWLRYGAAIYLRDCQFPVIRDNKVTGGQNALMMTRSNDGQIYNNDFSFNSGIGIGMYRSSRNHVMHNRVIFNVRGYSHGVYHRGQDSAGILVYEQSSNNIFYKNNVTHSGDGLFLWAGQSTMDSGQGGCNDNLIIGNDFSYAPTNGIEVTFSRNIILDNRIFECDHGIWGGYSYNTLIRDNSFRNNRIAIAIEHGQENKINHNLFSKDKEAIRLWSRREQPADPIAIGWGYAQHRDTRSRGYEIVSNSFNSNEVVFNITRSDSLHIFGNTIAGTETPFKIDTTVTRLDTTLYDDIMENASEDPEFSLPQVEKPLDAF
ncbi:MAG TPA: right-handed parallel beta-helix repeat-containing protein, partial [Chitinophagaceae bacterium]|nr:right-handed parallel beta-helix repeat-containing protein [Chitinophagaceae bacterium]